jgi:plastocyanin
VGQLLDEGHSELIPRRAGVIRSGRSDVSLVVARRSLIIVIVAVAVTVAAAGFALGRAVASNSSSKATASGAPAGQATGSPVQIQNFSFLPPTITIKKGGSVTWTNTDPFDHSIQSDNGTFNSDDLPQGKSFTAMFTTPGTYAYICGIHNNMKGTVVVQG